MVEFFKKYRAIFITMFLYSLAHGYILLMNGIYWDDWTLYDVESEAIVETFQRTGTIWVGYFHSFLLSFENGIWFYRIIVFISFLFAGLFLNQILSNIREISPFSKLTIVLIFMLFPVNSARLALIDVPYAISYFLFFLSFWLVTKYLSFRNIGLRILALLTLFASFSTESLLVFFIVLIIYIIYHERSKITSFVTFVSTMMRYMDFLSLPIIFWILRNIYWLPTEIRVGYNHVGLKELLVAPFLSVFSFHYSFIDVFNSSFQILSHLSFTIILVTILLALFKQKISSESPEDNLLMPNRYDYIFLGVGLLSFFAAVYPYNVVDNIPRLDDWSSRHQLLVPLGAAFLILYGIKIVSRRFHWKENSQLVIYSFLISLFTMANIQSYIEYEKDWYKQLSLVENFKTNEVIQSNSTFIFNDNFSDLNAKNRIYRFYEYNGLFKYAFNEETRFGIDIRQFTNMDDYKPYFKEDYTAHYNMKDYKIAEPQFTININEGTYDLDKNFGFLKLKYYELFNKEIFKEEIKNIVVLEIESNSPTR